MEMAQSVYINYKGVRIHAGQTYQEIYYTLRGLKISDEEAKKGASAAVLENQTEIIIK